MSSGLDAHVQILLRSYRHWLGRDLLTPFSSMSETARALFDAPFIVISHGTEPDPILNYGNRAALQLWEMSWEDFIKTPSRLTAEPMSREERARLLAEVEKKGYIDHYQGVRISSTGRRFKIDAATVWNLIDSAGNYTGQAATFERWNYL
jgi:MEKHLA domain-containing protein